MIRILNPDILLAGKDAEALTVSPSWKGTISEKMEFMHRQRIWALRQIQLNKIGDSIIHPRSSWNQDQRMPRMLDLLPQKLLEQSLRYQFILMLFSIFILICDVLHVWCITSRQVVCITALCTKSYRWNGNNLNYIFFYYLVFEEQNGGQILKVDSATIVYIVLEVRCIYKDLCTDLCMAILEISELKIILETKTIDPFFFPFEKYECWTQFVFL